MVLKTIILLAFAGENVTTTSPGIDLQDWVLVGEDDTTPSPGTELQGWLSKDYLI